MKTSNKRFGSNHTTGRQFVTVNFHEHSARVKGYRVVEVEEVKEAGISGINEVTLKLKNPVNRDDQPVVTEKHLVTDKYVSSFHNVQFVN